MPKRNLGTLLENIVVTESWRIILGKCNTDQPAEFCTSFAMPALSDYEDHNNDEGFDGDVLHGIAGLVVAPADTDFRSLMARCLNPSGGARGPNGALLAALLAELTKRTARLWVNDNQPGFVQWHEGVQHPPTGDACIHGALQAIGIAPQHVAFPVYVGTPYPESIAGNAQERALVQVLHQWAQQVEPGARLGFLDPMCYTLGHGNANQIWGENLQEWLQALSQDGVVPIISVHFTASPHGNINGVRDAMLQDGQTAGFPVMVRFSHDYFNVMVNIKGHSEEEVREIAGQLRHAVQQSWNDWYNAQGRGPVNLGFVILA